MSEKRSDAARVRVEMPFHGSTLSLESGWLAKQTDGTVIARQGDTVVMATVCSTTPRAGTDFFPLTVEYQEKAYAAGKIPGGFFKREGRLAEHEILTCRIIDRPIRPLFPEGYIEDVQLICTVLSADKINNPAILALTAASAALHISKLPFLGPIAGVVVGRVDGKLLINPSPEMLAKSDIEITVAATKEALVMVEGGAKMVPEAEILEALYFAHEEIKKLIDMQEQLRGKVGKEKMEFVAPEHDPAIVARVNQICSGKVEAALEITEKLARYDAMKAVKTEVKETLSLEFPERDAEVIEAYHAYTHNASRSMIVDRNMRIDRRGLRDVRWIECETDVLPRAHGSSLFTRGETQALVVATLGTKHDAQRMDTLTGDGEKTFMLHYNFPPYSVGEVKMLRGPGRREIGHGMLAERAISAVLPDQKTFPYVVRIVSEILESNGSSSMASVCGGSMALMDAGVPLKAPVAGVAMGLIKEGDKVAVLTDILGDEDHFGDMDFKVCGTKDGITALQMDIKCSGLSRETMTQALEQAREARIHILGEMSKAIETNRAEPKDHAPRITSIKISPDKIRDIIGPGREDYPVNHCQHRR
jgi:polyribonucleotide nucleotidyltransferase